MPTEVIERENVAGREAHQRLYDQWNAPGQVKGGTVYGDRARGGVAQRGPKKGAGVGAMTGGLGVVTPGISRGTGEPRAGAGGGPVGEIGAAGTDDGVMPAGEPRADAGGGPAGETGAAGTDDGVTPAGEPRAGAGGGPVGETGACRFAACSAGAVTCPPVGADGVVTLAVVVGHSAP